MFKMQPKSSRKHRTNRVTNIILRSPVDRISERPPSSSFWFCLSDHVAVHESASDAVDGSSTGTRVPKIGAPIRLPRFGGASHTSCHDNRFPGPRRGCHWTGGYSLKSVHKARPEQRRLMARYGCSGRQRYGVCRFRVLDRRKVDRIVEAGCASNRAGGPVIQSRSLAAERISVAGDDQGRTGLRRRGRSDARPQ